MRVVVGWFDPCKYEGFLEKIRCYIYLYTNEGRKGWCVSCSEVAAVGGLLFPVSQSPRMHLRTYLYTRLSGYLCGCVYVTTHSIPPLTPPPQSSPQWSLCTNGTW